MCSKDVPFSKRLLDLTLIIISAPITVPIFLLIAGYIKLKSPGPILFKQARVGLEGKTFEILKFRTMFNGVGTNLHENYVKSASTAGRKMEKLDDVDPRIIPGCRVLRASGVDELPQLINVVKGEMSLVGPRPCTIAEKILFPNNKRFKVLPGLTGLWQVRGKNKTTFKRMVALDTLYAKNRSTLLDLSIIINTPKVIINQVTGSSNVIPQTDFVKITDIIKA